MSFRIFILNFTAICCILTGCSEDAKFQEEVSYFTGYRDSHFNVTKTALQAWGAEFAEETKYQLEKYELFERKWDNAARLREPQEFIRQRDDLVWSLRNQLTVINDALNGTVTDDPATCDPLSKFTKEYVRAEQTLTSWHRDLVVAAKNQSSNIAVPNLPQPFAYEQIRIDLESQVRELQKHLELLDR